LKRRRYAQRKKRWTTAELYSQYIHVPPDVYMPVPAVSERNYGR